MKKEKIIEIQILNKKGYKGEDIKNLPQCYVDGELAKAGDKFKFPSNSDHVKVLVNSGQAKIVG